LDRKKRTRRMKFLNLESQRRLFRKKLRLKLRPKLR